MNELPLVLFTLLTQASVGLSTIAALYNFKNTGNSAIQTEEYKVALLSFILGLTGMIASFIHLGHPLNSINALKNIDSSWMSREILFMLIYLFSLAVIISIRLKLVSNRLTVLFRNLTFFSAVLLLYSMIRVYTLPALQNLDSFSLVISFLSTTVFTGAAALVLLYINDHEKSGNRLFLAGFALVIAFLGFIANPSVSPSANSIFISCTLSYLLSFIFLIPALIPRLKNIFAISAVIFIILGLVSEFLNRFILLSLTSFSI